MSQLPRPRSGIDGHAVLPWFIERPRMYDETTNELHVPVTNLPVNDSDATDSLTRDPGTTPANDHAEPGDQERTEWIVAFMNAICDSTSRPDPEGCIDVQQWLNDETLADSEIAMIFGDSSKPYELEKRAVILWEEVIRCQKYGTCEIGIGGNKYQPGGMAWGARLYQVLETIAYSRQIALEVVDGEDIRALVSAPVVDREKLIAKARGEI